MNVELLTKIAEWLEAGGREADFGYRFNMAHYYEDARPNCGAACCIAGAALELSGRPERGGDEMTEDLAGRLLGLAPDVAGSLFFAFGCPISIKNISPGDAARVVRHLIDTGVVKWSLLGAKQKGEVS